MTKNVITTIVVAVVIGVVGFFGGMKYGQSKAQAATTAAGTRTATGAAGGAFAGRTGARGGAGGAGFAGGQIIKQDSSSITVQLPNNGGTKIVLYSPSTTIGKIATGTATDLVVGQNVIVTGAANSDGSETATSIQIRPAGQGFGGPGGQGSASSTTQNVPMIPYQPGQ